MQNFRIADCYNKYMDFPENGVGAFQSPGSRFPGGRTAIPKRDNFSLFLDTRTHRLNQILHAQCGGREEQLPRHETSTGSQ